MKISCSKLIDSDQIPPKNKKRGKFINDFDQRQFKT